MMPSYLVVLLDLVDTVGHELVILALVINPVKGNRGVEPTMKVTRWLLNAACALVTRFAAICPDISSSRGIVKLRFAILDLAQTSSWVISSP
jgi:hypothetical protein